jgi:glutathione S-transferase
MTIYHIAYATDWESAKAAGEYRLSTKGRTLDEQGFIHASDLHQVLSTADFVYGDDDAAALVVLVVDPEKLGPGIEVRYEQVPGSADPFPHIYGPISPEAVTETLSLAKDEGGKFFLA